MSGIRWRDSHSNGLRALESRKENAEKSAETLLRNTMEVSKSPKNENSSKKRQKLENEGIEERRNKTFESSKKMMTAGKTADLRENSNVFFREHLPEVKSLKGPTRANAQTQNLDARPETAKGTGRKKPLTISLERYTKGRGAHKITTSTKKEQQRKKS